MSLECFCRPSFIIPNAPKEEKKKDRISVDLSADRSLAVASFWPNSVIDTELKPGSEKDPEAKNMIF
jgi:hypothetical protein